MSARDVENRMILSARDIARLKLVEYPDPILRRVCKPITAFDGPLAELAAKMLEIMHAHRGVGLAGPQVGLPLRIFVWNSTGEEGDDHVCLNPVLSNLVGQEEGDEGCLSITGVTVRVKRAKAIDLAGQDPEGRSFALHGEDLVARIWQHETDHLDGRLILDYQSGAEEIANRRALKELESRYKQRSRTKKRRGAG
jgi:peptide deformylase